VTVDILMQAVEELLERRDPLRKAEREAARTFAALLPERELTDEPLAQPVRPGANDAADPEDLCHEVRTGERAQNTTDQPCRPGRLGQIG